MEVVVIYRDIISKEYLINNAYKTNKEIANSFNCSTNTIRNLYKHYNINKRDYGKIKKTNKEWLEKNNYRSCKDIAKELNCCASYVSNLYKINNITKINTRWLKNVKKRIN